MDCVSPESRGCDNQLSKTWNFRKTWSTVRSGLHCLLRNAYLPQFKMCKDIPGDIITLP